MDYEREMSLERMARAFAKDWYARPDSGKDQPTLAFLLKCVVKDAYRIGVADERDRVEAGLSEFLGLRPKV